MATASLLLAGGAGAAMVKVESLILRADGGFTPRQLPRRSFAPIDFQGHADVEAVHGDVPPALEKVVLDFDRDGRLRTGGLAACPAESIADATPQEARSRCAKAIVGSGHVTALIALPGQAPIPASSPLTLFNGPRLDGKPTVVFHARTTVPAAQTFAIVVPIEQRSGGYRYRATLAIPPIAEGHGALTHVDVKIGRRYRFHGEPRSYVSARCSDSILSTRGRFSFADGTIIEGSVEKFCRVSE
jgi:hypothetical protein